MNKIQTKQSTKRLVTIVLYIALPFLLYGCNFFVLLGLTINSLVNPDKTNPTKQSENLPPQADLVVSDFTVNGNNSPVEVFINETINLSFVIENTGDAPSTGNILAHVYQSANNSIDPTASSSIGNPFRFTPLSTNGTRTGITNINAPLIGGSYYYGLCLDRLDFEKNNSNNCSPAIPVVVKQPGDRIPGQDFTLPITSFGIPYLGGISGNSTNIFVGYDTTVTLYDKSSKSQVSTKVFSINNAANTISAITSDGTSLWVNTTLDNLITGYSTSTFSKDQNKDFSANINSGTGGWTDGMNFWILGSGTNRKILAHDLTISGTNKYDSSKDINLNSDNSQPSGLWSDGTTMWAGDLGDNKLYAYDLNSLSYDKSRNIDLDLSGISNFTLVSFWSDGTTLWVLSPGLRGSKLKVYAFYSPRP